MCFRSYLVPLIIDIKKTHYRQLVLIYHTGGIMSNDLKVVPFNRELLKDWIYTGVEKELSGEQVLPIIEFYSKMGRSYIGLVDDKVIAIAGVYPLWPGVGGCFLFLNKGGEKYKKSIFKEILEHLDRLTKKYEIKSLIVECQDNILQANSLVRHLGFTKTSQVSVSVYSKGV